MATEYMLHLKTQRNMLDILNLLLMNDSEVSISEMTDLEQGVAVGLPNFTIHAYRKSKHPPFMKSY